MAQIRSINLPDRTRADFAAATVAPPGAVIHVAGQIGATKDGRIPACYESQIHLALLKLRRVIAAAGAEVSDICKLDVRIVNYDHKNKLHERHIRRFLNTHDAAVSVYPVVTLAVPEALFEIDAVLSKGTSIVSRPSPKYEMTDAEKPYDVVVVGAGLSGLKAAIDVVNAGLSCLVLEARDRVGGKTLSRTLKTGGVVELGGAWMNDTTETRMTALAKKYGCELLEQNVKGNAVFQDLSGLCTPFPYGEQPPFDEETQQHMDKLSHSIEDDVQSVDVWNPKHPEWDSLTFASYLRQKGASDIEVNTCGTWSRAMIGQEPNDISALYFLNYCKSFGGLLQLRSDEKDGGQHIRVKNGVQAFSEGMASDLPPGSIRLAHPVYSLHKTPDDLVEITTPSGVVSARKVIISVPTAVLKSLDFEPPLPESKTVLSEAFTYGFYAKVLLAFKTPFWIERGFCGLAQSFTGPAGILRDVSDPKDGKWILVCFMAGDNGRKWSRLPADKRQDQLLNQVGKLFASREVIDEQLIETVHYDWTTEKYSGFGCPSASLPPGVLDTVGDAIRAPFGNIHFVGHETAGEFKGFMEGAVRSGERGAAEVIKSLASHSAKKGSGLKS